MENSNTFRLFEKALIELEKGLVTALKTYSNVHRGTGHYSMVTTALLERAREIILEFLDLDKDRYEVIFCTPRRLEAFETRFRLKSMQVISSKEIGLPLGLRAIAIERKALPKGPFCEAGGGTVKMVYPRSAVWADAPNRFESGTPSVINAIALAKALQLVKHYAAYVFKERANPSLTSTDILHHDELSEFSGKELLSKLRKAVMDNEVLVPTAEGARPFTNLDNGASTPTFSPIWNVVCKIFRQAKSEHPATIQEVRKMCAKFVGAPLEDYDVIFTSNTTEAINIVVQNLFHDSGDVTEPVVLTTLLEHNSNELPWRHFSGASVIPIPVDEEGFMNLKKLERLLGEFNQQHMHGKKRIRIVALSGASNVLGTINDLHAISRIVHRYDAHLLVDGAQLVAHRSISLTDTNIDYFAFSGHKIYAPFGSGALVVKKGLLAVNQAELAKIKSSGEENVVGIAAMGKAFNLLQRIGMDVIEEYERTITALVLHGLVKIPGVKIFGVQDLESSRFKERLGIIAIRLEKVPHNLVALELAEYGGIGVRNGCFCAHILVSRLLRIHSFRVSTSKVLFRLIPKLTRTLLPGLVRVSFGLQNDENDVKHLIQVLERISREPQSFTNRLIGAMSNGTPFIPSTETQEQMNTFVENLVKQVFSLIKY